MTQARATLVSLDDTPWYHCVNRCVRRAFLCGEDHQTGRDYSHRRGWIADHIQQLAGVFAIDVAAFAVMSNHFHIVVRIDRERAEEWDTQEVLERWTRLFQGPLLVQRYLKDPEALDASEKKPLEALAETYRQRLHDLSWYMRALNEHIARQANAEDGVTGRFWEGRFKSQALLDEAALLAVMAYVDLNPIRAGIADTPEQAEYTAIHARIRALREAAGEEQKAAHGEAEHKGPEAMAPNSHASATALSNAASRSNESNIASHAASHSANAAVITEKAAEIEPTLPKQPLMPFDATASTAWAIPFAFDDYLQLLDWSGRAIRSDKAGAIPNHHPPILDRLGMDPEHFIQHVGKRLRTFGSAIGQPASLIRLCEKRQIRFLRGIQTARSLFARPRAA